jgi:hypothetical protein
MLGSSRSLVSVIGRCVVTKARSPQIVTALCPPSGSVVRQRMFSPPTTDHASGGSGPSIFQLRFGPDACGQCWARIGAARAKGQRAAPAAAVRTKRRKLTRGNGFDSGQCSWGSLDRLAETPPSEQTFTFFGRNLSLNRRVMAVCESLPPKRSDQLIHLIDEFLHLLLVVAAIGTHARRALHPMSTRRTAL